MSLINQAGRYYLNKQKGRNEREHEARTLGNNEKFVGREIERKTE